MLLKRMTNISDFMLTFYRLNIINLKKMIIILHNVNYTVEITQYIFWFEEYRGVS